MARVVTEPAEEEDVTSIATDESETIDWNEVYSTVTKIKKSSLNNNDGEI